MKNTIPKYWNSTLQALCYWIAYRKEYFYGNLMPEGAIVAELTQLLSTNCDSSLRIECERMYKDFGSNDDSNARMDICIGKRVISSVLDSKMKKAQHHQKFLEKDDLFEAIEVKRYEGDIKRLYEDMEKLGKFKVAEQQPIRRFLVVAGQRELPTEFFNKKHNLIRKNIYKGDAKIVAIPRISKKAYSTKKDSSKGVFAVLIEIL